MNDFSFGEPSHLLLSWAILPIVLVLIYAARRRRRDRASLLSPTMAARLAPEHSNGLDLLRTILLTLGLAGLLVALARPRFGYRLEEVKRRGSDLVVAIDVSRSMLSQDVHPDRLSRAKSYVKDLLKRVVGDRVALVAFAGKAVPMCPMTIDHAFFESVLDDLSPDSAPRGGTAIGDAIRSAIDLLDPQPDRDSALVLITDGEDHDSFPVEAAAQAAERGLKVFTVGIGDPGEGARVPAAGESGDAGFVKFEGQEVWSKMDEELLKQIALTTGGAYVPARTGTYDLGQVYVDHLSKLRSADYASEKRRRWIEQFQWFAAAGLGFYLLARALRVRRPRPALGVLALLLACSIGPSGSAAEPIDSAAAKKLNAGIGQLEGGEAKAALDAFDGLKEALPNEPRLALARGAALQKLGDVDGAKAAYEQAAGGADRDATIRARFNLGTLEVDTAKSKLGEHPEALEGADRDAVIARFESARDHFRSVLTLDRDHEDARHNLELLRLYWKNLKDQWKKHDEEKAKQEKQKEPLVEQLARMQREQEGIRREAKSARGSDGAWSEAVAKPFADRQKSLSEEMPILASKLEAEIDQQMAQSQGAPGSTAAPDPKAEERKRALLDIAEKITKASAETEKSLGEANAPVALPKAREVDEGLTGLYLMFAGYPQLVKRGLEVQKDLGARVAEDAKSLPDYEIDSAREERIGMLAQLLKLHAEQALPTLEKQTPPPVEDNASEEQKKQAEKQAKQLAGLVESMKRAVARSGEIPPFADTARKALLNADSAAAREPAAKALEILEYIAEPLKNDDQDDNGDKKQDDDKDQEKKDQDKKDQEKKDQDEKDDDKKQDDPKDGQQKSEPEKLSKDQVEKLLNQMKQREKDLNEKKQRILRLLATPVPVEKDW